MTPLVSCIVPTGDRAVLLTRCVQRFRMMRYSAGDAEMVIVDGGRRRSVFADRQFSDDSRIRYVQVDPSTSIGKRRNIAIEHARGELIAHMDDDDFYAPDYLAELVQWWQSRTPDLGGFSQFWHYDLFRKRGWKTNLWDTGHPYGATFIYPKALWAELGGFRDLQRGEDQEFFLACERAGKVIASAARPDLFVYVRHHRNVTGPLEPIFHPQWTEATRAVLGEEVHFFDDLAELVNMPTVSEEGAQFHLPRNLRRELGRR